MAKQLNVNGDNYDQFFTQILDNVEYTLHVYYNSRSGWYISFYESALFVEDAVDNTEALIYGGRKLMPNQDVFGRIYDDRLPTGFLYCVDSTLSDITEQVQLTVDNFGKGKRYNLVYFAEREFA